MLELGAKGEGARLHDRVIEDWPPKTTGLRGEPHQPPYYGKIKFA